MSKLMSQLDRKQVDVRYMGGVRALRDWCADSVKISQMDASKGPVLLASDTSQLQVRHPVPRLQRTLQEMYDAMPSVCANWPVSKQGVVKAVGSMSMLGGGTQYTLGRIALYAPKRGAVISQPFAASEVVTALKRAGRVVPPPDRAVMAIREEDVKVNADSDNGFPVMGTMRDPFARHLVLKLAGQLRNRLNSAQDLPAAIEEFCEKFPEVVLFKGKTKVDVYNVAKAQQRTLRFYNVAPRHLVVMMQSATQPLADAWKECSRENWTTGIGKGFAKGRADEMVTWLDREIARDGIGWTHTGDDTLVGRRWKEGDEDWAEVFSLDCSAFDLTQHSSVSEKVHLLLGQQLKTVDKIAGTLWHRFMRSRQVTLLGSANAVTRHWGPSGMPLQSEVNDTLMECFLQRLSKRKWSGKQQLAQEIEAIAAEVGFSVRLEDYFAGRVGPEEAALRSLIERRPFLYVGYYLHKDEGTGKIVPCLDITRFFGGGGFLNGGFVDKQSVGLKVSLALAGYSLSMGVPPAWFEPAHKVLRETAVACLREVGSRISSEDVEAEVRKHVFAGLPEITSVDGLVAAIEQDPRKIWLDKWEDKPPSLGDWADEPWEERASELQRFLDPGANEARPANPSKAGLPPPTPARVVAMREEKKVARQVKMEEKKASRVAVRVKGIGRKVLLRRGAFAADEDSESEELEEESDEELRSERIAVARQRARPREGGREF